MVQPEFKVINFYCPIIKEKVQIYVWHKSPPEPDYTPPTPDCTSKDYCSITEVIDGKRFTNWEYCAFRNQ